ncbi:MAG: T9SS type A sorting domain-containing protein [Bacteroidetes bacterium]|nr:T9SS type A sorting domain-containing protein [Bacteroidota bacterium]
MLIGSDYIADISIGRISATTQAEVAHILQKGINYETNPPNDNWIKNVLLVSHLEDAPDPNSFQACSEEIRTASYSENPSFTTAYGASLANGGDQATNSMVIDYINAGFGVVNYRGHGSGAYWWEWNIYEENFSNSDVANLNNNKLPIVFSIACNTSHLWRINDCLAEAFTKSNYGATAFLGATGETYGGPNNVLDTALFKNSFNSNINSIGLIFNNAVTQMLSKFTSGHSHIWTALKYLWLGDPAIELWTNTLSTFSSPSITVNANSVVVNAGIAGSNIIACSIDNGESYFSKVENASSATFSTSVRPLYITITKQNYLTYTGITGGNITTNTTLSDDLIIVGDLTVNSGAALTVNSGTELEFSNNASLNVNGTLIVNGTSSNNVLFDFQYPQWNPSMGIDKNGIKINSTGLAHISHAEIRNAYTGIFVNEGVALIDNCLIRIGYSGIHLYRTNYSSSDTYITNTRIYGQTVGIDMYYSTAQLSFNELDHNWMAINCSNFSSPFLAPNSDDLSESFGYNNIYLNSFGLFAASYSNPFLGRQTCIDFGGNNTIDNNSTKDVNLTTYCTVYAENNWWGGGPPSYYVGAGCFFDPYPFLSSPPTPGSGSIKITPEEQAFNKRFISQVASPVQSTESISLKVLPAVTTEKPSFNENWTIEWKLLYARNLIRVKKYNAAAEICENVISNYPDSSLSYLALDLLWQSRKNDNKTQFSQYVKNKSKLNIKKPIYGVAELMLAAEEKDNRISILDGIKDKYSNEPLVEHVLFQKFLYYLYEENSLTLAAKISSELGQYFPDSESYLASQRLLGSDPNQSEAHNLSKNESNESNSVIPKNYELLGNYPNPFNPNTTISYSLPFNSNVQLTIYDITGKVVKEFIIDDQAAGYQNVVWHGINRNGVLVSSGVYFYRFKAVSLEKNNEVFTKTAKIMLLK